MQRLFNRRPRRRQQQVSSCGRGITFEPLDQRTHFSATIGTMGFGYETAPNAVFVFFNDPINSSATEKGTSLISLLPRD